MSDDLPTVSNFVEDASGQVVQAGSVYGDIHLHQPTRPAELPLRTGLIPLRAASFQERGDLVTDGVTVLFGMGGVGKTQLAADHAQRRWNSGNVDFLLWVTASSREAIVSAYTDAATKLTGQPGSAQILLEWLATTNASWLVVLDDLQTPADLAQLWPPPTGQVIVTTRRRDSALRGHLRTLVEVDVFDEPEAFAYVSTVLAHQPRLLDDVEGLVRDLGCLPVALAQAAAYMVDNHLSCSEYRVRFAARRLSNVVPDADGLPDEHQTTVAATWSLSVELANRLTPEGIAHPLLEIASVLDPNGIPVTVFATDSVLMLLSESLGRPVDESDARDGLGCLHRLSLITLDFSSTSREVRVHPLVQRATRDAWPDERTGPVIRAAADAVYRVWPEVERDAELGQILRSNVDALSLIGQSQMWESQCHIVLLRAGYSRSQAGLAAEASDYFGSLCEVATQRLGPDHKDTLRLRNYQTAARGRKGDLKGAMTAFEELLADQIRVLGPDHPQTLLTSTNLAYLYGQLGDNARAATAYQEVLINQLRVLGPDHRNTLITRNRLAKALADEGDHETAAAAHQAVLSDQLRVLGPDHRDTLVTRVYLTRQLGESGDFAGQLAARKLLLADALRILGPDHPDTLTSRHNIARSLADTGDDAAATDALRELLADRIRVLGPDHPHTLHSRSTLAYLQAKAGDLEVAIATLEELLTDQIRVLGSDHPDAQRTQRNLDYCKQRLDEAES